jgi:hypothetical protein
LERDATVFLGALPSAALLASRAAFDAETILSSSSFVVEVEVVVWEEEGF